MPHYSAKNPLESEIRPRGYQEKDKAIFDVVPALIFYKDQENRYIWVNMTFAEFLGFPKEEIIGKSAFELFPAHADDYWNDDKEVIASGNAKRGMIKQLKNTGGIKWFRVDKAPLRDEGIRLSK